VGLSPAITTFEHMKKRPRPDPSGKPAKPARPARAPKPPAKPATAGRPKPSIGAPLTSFAVSLRSARDAAGITQTALGEVSGFGKRSIARYEAGGALPSIQAAAALSRILGTSLDQLGGMDSDQDPELARMLAQVAGLSEEDRAFIRRALQLVTDKNKR